MSSSIAYWQWGPMPSVNDRVSSLESVYQSMNWSDYKLGPSIYWNILQRLTDASISRLSLKCRVLGRGSLLRRLSPLGLQRTSWIVWHRIINPLWQVVRRDRLQSVNQPPECCCEVYRASVFYSRCTKMISSGYAVMSIASGEQHS